MVTVKFGAICRPKLGQLASGDAVGTWQSRSYTLAAVIDGLGSGPEAAQASGKALDCVADNRDEPLSEILARCHQAVHDTRGAVIGLVRVDHRRSRLTFTGVGNIGFSAAAALPMQPVCQNGLVGQRLPRPVEFEFGCRPGDLVAIYSDGISSHFGRRGGLAGLPSFDWTDPQKLAQQVLDLFGQADDDASVLIMMITEPPVGARRVWS